MAQAAVSNSTGASILVIDDEEIVRIMVREALCELGHHVTDVTQLEAARRAIRESHTDLILSDIHLQDSESGIDLLHELVPHSPDIAVVMMTGTTDVQVAIHCLREGAFDYLTKPFTFEELQTVVERVLQRQRKMIAERERAEEQLRMLGKFSSENPNPVLRVAEDGAILYANDASQVLLNQWNCQVGQKAPDFLRQLIAYVQGKGKRRDIEVEGAGRVFSFAVIPIKGVAYLYLYGHDVTSLKETERELIRVRDEAQRMALHDALTGLPNRTLLEDRLQFAIAQCERHSSKLAVVFIDLDNFKQINDTQGHKVGDQILVAITELLQETIRKTDTLARWGGDEMIVLIPEIHDPLEVRQVCERLKNTVQKRIFTHLLDYPVTLSMGIAIYPDDAESAETLLQQADMALYLAKTRGRNELILLSEVAELKSFQQKAHLRTLLSQAVSARAIQVHYQPIINAHTGLTEGAEVLARWHQEGHGWISPGTFIPLAENMGLIEELGKQVLELSLRQLSQWNVQGLALTLSINISVRQLFKYDFLNDLLQLTGKLGLKPAQLILEITESQTIVGLASEARRLRELSENGFRLSIDDFGQGYSSLSSLHEMPVNELKVDMKFVRNLHTQKGRQILQAIVDMTRRLDLETVAEGVEVKDQVAILKQMGVDRLQGFFFSPALPAADFLEFLQCHRPDPSLFNPPG